MRRFVAWLLRRLADRVEGCVRNRHPGGVYVCNCRGCRDLKRTLRVKVVGDADAFQQSMRNVEQTLRRATQARVRRQPQWPEPPPPQPDPDITRPERRS